MFLLLPFLVLGTNGWERCGTNRWCGSSAGGRRCAGFRFEFFLEGALCVSPKTMFMTNVGRQEGNLMVSKNKHKYKRQARNFYPFGQNETIIHQISQGNRPWDVIKAMRGVQTCLFCITNDRG